MHENAKVKQELDRKSVPEKVAYGENVTQMMGADQTFNTLNAKIATAAQATTDLDTAKNAKDAAEAAAHAATAEQHNKEEEYDQAFDELGNGVDDIAKGDKTIIDLSGMDSFLPGKAADIGQLPQVEALDINEGANPGEIDLAWDALNGANSYLVEVSIDNPNNWAFAGTSTKSSFTADGLVSGTTYWFRVAGVGAAGQGPFSNPSTKVAP